jgi:3,4-dihydroxy 2-butanone 4-phosphate synthase/GTP cyclohydrolase II
MTQLDKIEDAILEISEGRMIIVVDDADRENEGDLIMAASKATPEQVAFMIRHTSGILCTPITLSLARRLRLDPMVSANDAPLGTAFTVSIDYKFGLTTGISAEERTNTIRSLANNNVNAEDFVRPGHIFPLIAKDGGVLVRSGHTEAGVDLSQLAGLEPVSLLAELVNDDGTVKRLPELFEFAKAQGLKIVSIADLIEYRQQREQLVERLTGYDIMTPHGPASAHVYKTPFDSLQHIAIVFGDITNGHSVPARIHRERVISDLFSANNSPASSLDHVMKAISEQGKGVLVYLRDGLATDPGEAEPIANEEEHATAQERQQRWREIGLGAQILKDLGIDSICLLATHHRQYVGLSGFGIEIEDTIIL